jgi:hypothetical protein
MKHRSRALRAIAMMLLAVGLFAGFGAAPASAASYARITLHVNECSHSYSGDIFNCHNNRVSGALFYIAGSAKYTDWNGIATGAPSAGSKSVRVNSTTASWYVNSYVVCTDQYNGNTLYNGLTNGTTIWITTTANHLTICDWYLLY